jgi:UDP-glucuronate decarboxylase
MHPQDGRVVSSFIIQALQNQPITIFGSGKQTRAFCYVDDLIDGLTRLMNIDGQLDTAVNLGNPSEIAIAELAEAIIALTNSSSKLALRPLPVDDPRQRCPDITRAKQLLHWAPAVSLEEGLTKTIAYFDQLLSSSTESKKLVWRSVS